VKGIIMAKKAKGKKKKRSRRTEAIETAVPKDEKLMKATEKLLKKRKVALDKVERSLRSKK